MTIPYERTLSVVVARQLLDELARASDGADLERLRDRARSVLRHFPEKYHLQVSARILPDVWADPDAKWYE
ncbi:hypothetical protein B0G80_6037 [Paraburkholderia sp. BL6669N2]|uniref:BPSL0761 family protein n=1 Tax=Paraburkholderia sp. BL6669N2 TaxID=1938807 RepID=UPI000E39C6AD|nr:BPSL0761 family protein [Paraburkholderia sp. BL6669N2]REG49639.1 hypothetical protein B0G80_6037 [Paraburkholderia sp. BL6669N2]